MTEPSQLALDPDVSPGRVLSRQALDERRNPFEAIRASRHRGKPSVIVYRLVSDFAPAATA
ncbi:hypothetical protein [Streptomyces sp. ME19-01-6]|uniref:hypothetical protein n=1 Tax=Streptomyces sp. ME19-01-6 TaxID=3028686 RepID=UPI0029AC5190|nr:hypothetical protein [Streptomyces sp. ME19-01-6]MDX3224157.1 hypothetical protein [Streptomyces sp. ME19-01-6]